MSLINSGNVDDIRNSLRHCEHKLSIKDINEEIEKEKSGKNRASVISLLKAAMKRKMKQ